MCVEIYDLASVSHSVRSGSNSVRQSVPPVSANVRRKLPLIARSPHFDCASLQVRTFTWCVVRSISERSCRRLRYIPTRSAIGFNRYEGFTTAARTRKTGRSRAIDLEI